MSNFSPYRVAIVEDDPDLLELLQEELASQGYKVTAYGCAEDFLGNLEKQVFDLIISDIRLPGIDGMQLLQRLKQQVEPPALLLITAFGTVRQAVNALKLGADDFLTKPLDLEHLALSVQRLLVHKALRAEVQQLRQRQEDGPAGLVGKSRAMRRLYQQITQVATAQGAVLILGESGTGKELVARAIHQQSPRKEHPFIAINCAGIPAELMESEFFGHAAGAFTGARQQRSGLFKEADGGTLLLDEIAEMPLLLQAKLLRVLQEGTIRPVGSDQELRINVRILASTHQNLERGVVAGTFREDLFYRLETFNLSVPPLRERGDDIESLAMFYLQKLQQKQPRDVYGLSQDTVDCLYRYPFPGNVRELQNALERAYTFATASNIEPVDLPARIHNYQPEVGEIDQSVTTRWPTLQQLQQSYVLQVLEHTQGNKQQASQLLGITRRTLYRWLEQTEPESSRDE